MRRGWRDRLGLARGRRGSPDRARLPYPVGGPLARAAHAALPRFDARGCARSSAEGNRRPRERERPSHNHASRAAKGGVPADLLGCYLVLAVPKRLAETPPELVVERARRILIADPRTALGAYTAHALSAGALRLPRKLRATDSGARGIIDRVAAGRAATGVVLLSDAQAARGRVASIELLSGPDQLIYEVAVLKSSRHRDAARRVVALLRRRATTFGPRR